MAVSDKKTVEIEINGQPLTASPEQTIIQVADAAGIYIPRFCYHKQLSIAANCRMCLVEVEKSPKALPACATPVMPGMKVFTKSQKTIDAQRAVMEFLLINHPLDCPICDQGGECELQDLSMGYGSSHSCYDEPKRSVADQNLGPLIETEMTRCIYCTRCVRFGDEIAGLREMGVIGRGENQEVDTYVAHSIQSEVGGNIIDLCPVGALTNKPYRFTARPWELDQFPSIGAHDCYGSNINVHTRYGKVMRVVSRENLSINEMWIADRDRYSYTGLYQDRVTEPLARINGQWETVSWEKAFELATQGLQQVLNQAGNQQLGALLSPNATVEECYLLQKLMRSVGSQNIDHRLRAIDTSDQDQMGAFPGLAISIAELEQADAVLLIGSNLQKEQPLAALRLRKAVAKGAKILAINPVDYAFNFAVAAKSIVAPQQMIDTLSKVLQALQQEKSNGHNEAAEQIAHALRDKQHVCVIVGAFTQHHPQAATLRYLAQQIAMHTKGSFNIMTDGANSAGAWLAGAIPHREPNGKTTTGGLTAYEMLKQKLAGYILLNVEPSLDCANAAFARESLQQAQYVLALSIYRDPLIMEHAHLILPITPFTETSGTFVNATGEWQSFKGVAKPVEEARPAWKVLRVLGNFLQVQGFDYESSEEVKRELKDIIEKQSIATIKPFNLPKDFAFPAIGSLTRTGEIPLYALDSLVRRAKPLQEAQQLMEGEVGVARMHEETAKQLNVQAGMCVTVKQIGEATLTVEIDNRMAKETIWVAGGIPETSYLGDLFGEIACYKSAEGMNSSC